MRTPLFPILAAALALFSWTARVPAAWPLQSEASRSIASPAAGPANATLPQLPVASPQWRSSLGVFTRWLATPQGAAAAMTVDTEIARLRALTPSQIAAGQAIGPLAEQIPVNRRWALAHPDQLSQAQLRDLIRTVVAAQKQALPEVEAAVAAWIDSAKSGRLTPQEVEELANQTDALSFYGGRVRAGRRTLHAVVYDLTVSNARNTAAALQAGTRQPEPAAIAAAAGTTPSASQLKQLSKNYRRQLFAAEEERLIPETSVKSAVVLGAGPAGLMSTYNLLKHGARVTLVEQREQYNRPIHFNVRQSFLDQMAWFDPVLVPRILEKMGTIDRAEFVDATIDRKIENVVPGIRQPDSRLRIAGARLMMESPSVGQIKVDDLEIILYKRLEELNEIDVKAGRQPRVKIMRNFQADLVPSGNGRKSVLLQRIADRRGPDGRSQRARTGTKEDLGVPDLIVVAEGANSATREQLGVERTPTSPETRYVAGYLDRDIGGLIRRRYDESTDDSTGQTYGIRQILVGNSKRRKAWTVVEVPEYVAFANAGEIQDYFIDQAAKILGISRHEADQIPIEWGPNLFRLQQWISDRAVAGSNVILIGDAVGNAHFLTSGGVMTAAVPHQQELDRLLESLAVGRDGAQTLAIYNARVRAATLEWARLGIREFGRQVAAVNFGARFTELLADLRRREGRAETAPEDLSARSLTTSRAEQALEGHPQGDAAWNERPVVAAALPRKSSRERLKDSLRRR